MGILGRRHGWRAVILAWGMVWFAPAADLRAGTLDSAGTPEVIDRSAEPFGLSASVLSAGALREKWRGVARKLDDEGVQLALCDGDRERCVSPAALQLLAMVDNARVRDGRARLGEINRAINLAIRPMSDLAQYGEIDVWSSPLATFAHGAGDCEDYAIAKFVALRLAGVAPGDLRIVIMHDTIRGEDHAVAAARLDGHWLTLDNRRMAMIEDAQVRNYRPTFVIDQYGIMQYVDAPLLAGLPGSAPAPANLAPTDLARSATLNAEPGLISPFN
ncbi:MAG: transglutaminase-like cysteine peptidase [Bradyrhizobium sp.]|nr:transglutaminase-like cysteine peptidase [Bradyrhizobium sp.]